VVSAKLVQHFSALNSLQQTWRWLFNSIQMFHSLFSWRLICYDFVSSSTLEDFLCEKGTVLNFDAVCAIAGDVISAIERLQDLGIFHNNITTNNILIGQCPRVCKIIRYKRVLYKWIKVVDVFSSLSFHNSSNKNAKKASHEEVCYFLLNVMNHNGYIYTLKLTAFSAVNS